MKKSSNYKFDVVTAQQFVEAMPRFGGLSNTWPMLGTLVPANGKTNPNQKLPDIKQLNDFEFKKDGLLLKRHSNIGEGKFYKAKPFHLPLRYKYKMYLDSASAARGHPPRLYHDLHSKNEEKTVEGRGDEKVDEKSGIDHGVEVKCATPHCSETFKTFKAAEMHNMKPYCVMKEKPRKRKESAVSYARKKYVSKYGSDMYEGLSSKQRRAYVTHLDNLRVIYPHSDVRRVQCKYRHTYQRSWGLKKRKVTKNFSESQIAFAFAQWEYGEKFTKKVSPYRAEQLMKTIKDPNDPTKRWFSVEDRLDEAQLRGLFSRFTVAKKKKAEEELAKAGGKGKDKPKKKIRRRGKLQADEAKEAQENVTQEEEEEEIRNIDGRHTTKVALGCQEYLKHEKPLAEQDCPKMVSDLFSWFRKLVEIANNVAILGQNA